VGEVDPLRTALALGFEFSFQISPGIYLGAGTGLLRGSEKSLVDYPLEPIPGTFTAKPSVQATPVRISLSFYPLENWYIKGAVGYYFAKTQYFYRMFAGPVDWQEWTGKTTSQGLGAEGSAGAEWDITSNLRLFLEAGYRYAKIKRFVGKEFYSDAGIEDLVTEGTLYFFQKTGPNERIHPLLFVRETLPDEEGVVEAREAQVDFSGAVLRIGIRVRF
jgi:hypothetical protein